MDSYLAIREYIEKRTSDLLKTGSRLCCNIFSKNILYVKRIVDKEEQEISNFFEVKKRRFQMLQKKSFLSMDELSIEIQMNKTNVSWVDFILYFSAENLTIIMVEFILGDNASEINYHSSIMVPPEYIDTKEKFDVNWHFDDEQYNILSVVSLKII